MTVPLQHETIMTPIIARAALFATALSATSLHTLNAQDSKPQERVRSQVQIRTAPDLSLLWSRAADRAVLGVTLGSHPDTSGVRIDDVDATGPAAKAGLKTGDVITEINGISLRVSAADAADMALAGIAQRRLQRTMAKAKPGDDVDLRVRSNGTTRSLKIKTVSAADLDGGGERRVSSVRSNEGDQQGAIGVSIGGSGNVRDTLGLFISSVVVGGPAEKGGIIEGERVAAVNGVDVRVPKEDIEDMSAMSARVNRFVREVQKVTPGGAISLRVYGNGRYRDVTLKAVKTSELPNAGWQMSVGDGGVRIMRGGSLMPPMIERLPQLRALPPGAVSPRPPQGRLRINGEDFDLNSEAFEGARERLRVRLEDLGRDLGRDLRIELRDAPKVRTGPVLRMQTAPKRGLTSL
ncbi:MAG: PDZ domain-containing protein [Gemmatimonadaceae bacterium]|nr:PDZ domain-containing protein [Gemmatimonadaceae bacterium]